MVKTSEIADTPSSETGSFQKCVGVRGGPDRIVEIPGLMPKNNKFEGSRRFSPGRILRLTRVNSRGFHGKNSVSANLEIRFRLLEASEKCRSEAGEDIPTHAAPSPAVHVTFRSRGTNPPSSRRNSAAADGTTISKYRSHRAE